MKTAATNGKFIYYNPLGGGDTSLIPFFQEVEKERDLALEGVCIYLNDVYGDFPANFTSLPVLWMVTASG